VPFKVGCVPYLNAKPLVRRFVEMGSASPVEVVFDVPSRLPQLLDTGEVQAILVSSIEAFRRPCRVVSGVSISSQRAVKSVRLFSEVPFEQVNTLTLDPSSMTSNALAQIVLDELYDARPVIQDPAQAQVLIGDAGMRREAANFILDLGSAWREISGYPFVWAVWLGSNELTTELADHLREASQWGQRNLFKFLQSAADEAEFDLDVAEKYLTKVMDYELGADHQQALKSFRARLFERGWAPAEPELEFV
jgi:chorismate dehydratase